MRFRDAEEKDFKACLPLFRQLWRRLKIGDSAVETQVLKEIKAVFTGFLRNLMLKS